MTGTVNISRRIWDDTAFRRETFSEREAFIWLIMEASWKPRAKRIGDYVAKTGRGEVAVSVRFMANAWGWTPGKVQRYLKRIEKLNLIRRKTDTGMTLLTICKYNDYQNKPKAPDTGPIHHRYTTDTNENKDAIRMQEKKAKTPTEILAEIAGHEAAENFVAHRKEIRKPITPRAATAMVKKLSNCHDPAAVLNESVANGWQGVFPEKFKTINGGGYEKPSKSKKRISAFVSGARGAP